MTYHFFAVPVTETTVGPAIEVGTGKTVEEAIEAVKAAGYTIVPEGDGGDIDRYDDEDGPAIYNFEPDGLGAIGVTVVSG